MRKFKAGDRVVFLPGCFNESKLYTVVEVLKDKLVLVNRFGGDNVTRDYNTCVHADDKKEQSVLTLISNRNESFKNKKYVYDMFGQKILATNALSFSYKFKNKLFQCYYDLNRFYLFQNLLFYKDESIHSTVIDGITKERVPEILTRAYYVNFSVEHGDGEMIRTCSDKVKPVPFAFYKKGDVFQHDFISHEAAVESDFFYPKNCGVYIHKNSNLSNYRHFISNTYEQFRNQYVGTKTVSTNLITSGLNYTFGVEIETINGRIPSFLRNDLNIACVRDGSCGNGGSGEYVTGVLQGDDGFYQLKNICNHVSYNCEVDNTCGLHVHVGNVIFTKEFMLAMYKLGYIVQDEVFSMFPLSRLKTRNQYYINGHGSNAGRNWGSSCGKLPKMPFLKLSTLGLPKETQKIIVSENYNKMYGWLLNNDPDSLKEYNPNTRKVSSHPNRFPLARYVWLNLIPCNFSKNGSASSYTVEFRNHHGTMNYYKIKNWILICMAMVHYVENNAHLIFSKSKITLAEILEFSYKGRKLERLIEYIEKRKEMYSNLDPEENARTEDQEYRTDGIKQLQKFTKIEFIKE